MRELTFHSGEEMQCEEGGTLRITRYATESGALRTAVSVVPPAVLTDRDVAILAGRLLAFSFAPAAEPATGWPVDPSTGVYGPL